MSEITRGIDDRSSATLAARLERVRLERRVHQLERVLERLCVRVQAADAGAPERGGLHRAIADFEQELVEVRRRLGQLRES